MNWMQPKFAVWAALGWSVACALLLAWAADWSELWTLILTIPMLLWMIAPIAVLALAAREHVTALAALMVLMAISGHLYWRAFLAPDLDPQSGLIVLFLPLYQWIAVVVVITFLVVSGAIKSRFGRRGGI